MISFTSIITAIKGLSIAAKVGLGVGVVAVVAGGTAGTVAIINANQPHEETQIVASNPNDDNSPSEQKDTQIGETGEAEDDNNKTEQTANDNKPTTSNSQTTTQKPNNSSTSNNQSNSSSSSNQALLLPSHLSPVIPLLQANPLNLRNQLKSLIIILMISMWWGVALMRLTPMTKILVSVS